MRNERKYRRRRVRFRSLLILLAGICGILGAVLLDVNISAAPVSLHLTTTTGVNGKLAYTRLLGENAEIIVMNQDGGNQTNLTNNPATDQMPSWSPGGGRLAFSSTRGQTFFPGNIYFLDPGNGNVTQRTTWPDSTDTKIIAPTWSPDGTKLLFINVCFVCTVGPSLVASQFEVINSDGPLLEKRILRFPGVVNHSPSWSPDGTRIAFAITHFDFRTIPRRITAAIYVVNSDGSGVSKIASVSGPDNTRSNKLLDGSPAWSPDGTRLLFTGHQTGDSEIYVVNSGGGNLQRLTNNDANDGNAVWSPDGTRIAFVSDRNGNQDIYLMDPDGRNQMSLTTSTDDEFAPSWQNLAVPEVVPPAPATIQFSDFSYDAAEEAGSGLITITRLGNMSSAASVTYTTSDGTATAGSDYVPISGIIQFAPGEANKLVQVSLLNDFRAEGVETVKIALSNPSGAILGGVANVALIITDDEVPAPLTPIDDAEFFTRQQYLDFLNREPDAGGLAYWKSRIVQCRMDTRCIHEQRIGVSAAFFIEQEFQLTGSFVYRLYKASYGRQPSYAEFGADRSRLVIGSDLEASRQALLFDWVRRAAFRAAYPDGPPETFVNKLFDTAGLTPYAAERQQLIEDMRQGKTREQALNEVIEIAAFKQREFNPSFVLMQYFGYLRRERDAAGYQFWLDVLNNRLPNDPSGYRTMVCAFLTSLEYRNRFSPVHTRSNSDCN